MRKIILVVLIAAFVSSCADHEAMVEKSRIHYDMAFDLLQKGEQAQAISQVNEAIRLNPKDPTYRNLLGLIYMNRSMLEPAEKEFLESLRLKPDYADVNNNLCGLYITQGQWDRAIEQCKKAISNITYASPERAYLNM